MIDVALFGAGLALIRNYQPDMAPTHFKIKDLLEKFDKSGPPIPQKWSPERLAEGNKLLSQLQKQAPELLKTEAGKSLARVVEFNQPRAAAKIDDETRARARAFVEEMTKPKA